MSGIEGTPHTQPMSQAQGRAPSGRIDPRLAGVVRHAVLATPRLATDLASIAQMAQIPLEARQASVVAE